MTALAVQPRPACARCGAPDPIRGEGEQTPVCGRCIRAMGRIAAEPFTVPDTVRERLLARSLDVVHLNGGAWLWTSAWPDTGDDRLLRGGFA